MVVVGCKSDSLRLDDPAVPSLSPVGPTLRPASGPLVTDEEAAAAEYVLRVAAMAHGAGAICSPALCALLLCMRAALNRRRGDVGA